MRTAVLPAMLAHGAFLRWPPWPAAGLRLTNSPEECALFAFPPQPGHGPCGPHHLLTSQYLHQFRNRLQLSVVGPSEHDRLELRIEGPKRDPLVAQESDLFALSLS
jgi:hypothetical protein